MKQIHSGEIYEILPITNGIIFSYKKDDVNNKVIVAYKMISFTGGQYTDIAKNIYLLTKFGSNYKSVTEHFENYITVKSLLLPNGKVFLLYPDGKAKLLDLDASEIWSGDLLYRGAAPTDIKLHNNALWATYAQHNVLVKFNLNTMRAEIRLGNKKGPFNSPKDIFIEGDCAFISNSGSNKLIQVNLNTYDVLDYENFEEPVYQYLCVDDNKIVILESGLYLI